MGAGSEERALWREVEGCAGRKKGGMKAGFGQCRERPQMHALTQKP